MNAVKILHIADIHFGRKISGLSSEKSELRRNETYITLEHTLNRFADAQIVLIAGDIFDADDNTDYVSGVKKLFENHTSKRFFIACGNHDCLETPVIKKLRHNLSPNVHVFEDKMESVYIEELDTCVYGMSFGAEHSYTSFLHNFIVKDNSHINLMVMHADVDTDSKYNSISTAEIGASRLDYLALGHIHRYSGILRNQETYYAYPGVLEPQGFDETGECGVIYGEISKEAAKLDFYPASCRRYHCMNVDLGAFSSEQELISYLSSNINSDDLYRIILSGNRGNFEPNIKLYQNVLQPFYLEVIDDSIYSDNILDYIEETGLKGKTAFYLKKLSEDNKYSHDIFLKAAEILTKLMCKG